MYIKREDALQALTNSDVRGYEYAELNYALKRIPSVNIPELRGEDYRRGYRDAMRNVANEKAGLSQTKWIQTPNHTIRCPLCGSEFTSDIMDSCLTVRLIFPISCPICGSRMTKGADDE